MKNVNPIILLICGIFFFACSDDDDPSIDINSVEAPATFDFKRNGSTSVSFSGQTDRINMGEELISAMLDFDGATENSLIEMYRNETLTGEDVAPFSDPALNSSTKTIKSKVAASKDYFSANTTDGAAIKGQFESWMAAQISEVFPNENELAAPGVAGQIADGSSVRYINGQGVEYNQLVNKGLIGALMADQMLNNYLSVSVLDEADSRDKNDADVLEDGENYTFMEHKWDEAYGYAYGTAADITDPNITIGGDDSFINKYIGRVEGDPDFTGIADEIFDAFKLGRAAIVAKNYELRDEQAQIIREKISEVIGIRAVYYLQQAKIGLEQSTPSLGTVFHDLSEGLGFIYSLQFTRNPSTNGPYLSKTEVDDFMANILGDGENGLWDITVVTLDRISQEIADRFEFTVAQAAE